MKLFQEYRGLHKGMYILFIGRVVTNLGSLIWPMMTLILKGKLGMNAGDIATLVLFFSVLSLPVSLVGGKLADRFNKKHIIVICDCVSIATYFICAWIPFTIFSVYLFVFASLFQTIEWPAYDALVADLSTPENRERAYSLQYLGANIGMMVAPILGGFLFKDYLWLAFLLSGIMIGISTILIGFYLKDIRKVKSTVQSNVYEEEQTGSTIFTVFKQKKILILFLVCVGLGSIVYAQYSYLIPLDLATIHGDQGAVLFGTLSSVNAIVVVVFTPWFTKKFRSLKDVKKIFLGRFLQIVGLALFAYLLGNVWIYYVAMVIFTWGEVMNTIGSSPYVTRRIPASHRGRMASFIGVVSQLLSAGFQKVIGWVYDVFGSLSAWNVVFFIGGIYLILMTIVVKKDKQVFPDLYASEN